MYGEAGVKLARDMRGRFVTSAGRTHEPDPRNTALAVRFLEQYLPQAAGPPLSSRVCLYDMAPNREFVLDPVPGHPNVSVFDGAGHAGKFAALIGSILADLTTGGTTEHDVAAFSLSRRANVEPDDAAAFRLDG